MTNPKTASKKHVKPTKKHAKPTATEDLPGVAEAPGRWEGSVGEGA